MEGGESRELVRFEWESVREKEENEPKRDGFAQGLWDGGQGVVALAKA